jgi:hypothetical protein
MYEDAREKFQRTGHPQVIAAFRGLGKNDEAFKILDEWERRSDKENVDPVYLAMAYLGVGDKEHVFEYLDKAINDRHPRLMDFISNPYFIDILQSETRFKAIFRKVNMEQFQEDVIE